jgi:site-specific recombinase XerD
MDAGMIEYECKSINVYNLDNEKLITDIQNDLVGILSAFQLEELGKSLGRRLKSMGNKKDTVFDDTNTNNGRLLDAFISAKRFEGCSEKSLVYYGDTIRAMIFNVDKSVRGITTDDMRQYLSKYQETRNSSKVTIDNMRRIFNSFFRWLEDENYILKSPMRRIHQIRIDKVIKETITDEQLEKLRNACINKRDLAMLELLISTGMRVGELVKLNREDINFHERECVVFGKGNKQRKVYFDARTKIHLLNYLESRKDKDTAVFVSLKSPVKRLCIGGVEHRIKELAAGIGIEKIHPHKFRRTLATRAIDRGMPIEQVQMLLGHEKIETTMLYAMVNQTNVKNAHRKFIGG